MRVGKVRFKWVNSWKDKKTGRVYTKYRAPGGFPVLSSMETELSRPCHRYPTLVA